MTPTTRLDTVRQAAAKAAAARAERDQAIRLALATHTYREVGEAAGLSHQRIAQIAKGA